MNINSILYLYGISQSTLAYIKPYGFLQNHELGHVIVSTTDKGAWMSVCIDR